ncbi:MAG: hypothetical protein DWH91_14405 [Planctomycetota bacterium]|nr:MAG: hypothetical protein DWH91_14405 [Planctomycetota bacterium]
MSYLDVQTTSTRLREHFAGIQQVFPMPDERRINPQRLTLAELARALSNAGSRLITPEQIEADLAAGAPRNADGTVNILFYIAWLARESGNGR